MSLADELAAFEQSQGGGFADTVGRYEWERKQQERHPILQKAVEAGRGVYRGIENTAVGATDLVGDVAESVGLPRGPFKRREEMRTYVPYSTGSKTEQGGGLVGSMVFPGGATAKATTAGGALLRGALAGGAYGAIQADEGERIAAAANNAATGGVLSGAMHALTRGVGKVSPEAQRLEDTLNERLGDRRIGGRLPTPQRTADDIGSRVVGGIARRWNRGVKAVKALEKSRRVADDVAQTRLEDVYGDSGAGEEALRYFKSTRDVTKSMRAGDAQIKRELDEAKRVAAEKIKEKKHAVSSRVENQRAHKAEAIANQQARVAHAKIDYDEKLRLDLVRAQEAGIVPTEPGPALTAYKEQLKRDRINNNKKLAAELRAVRARENALVTQVKTQGDDEISQMLARARYDSMGYVPLDPIQHNILKDSTSRGKLTPRSVARAGDRATAELMAPLTKRTSGRDIPNPQNTARPRDLGYGTAITALAAGSGMPAVAVPAGLATARMAQRALQANRYNRAQQRMAEFSAEVASLPALKDSRIANFLLGDTAAQNKIKALVDNNRPLKEIEKTIYRMAATAGALPELED